MTRYEILRYFSELKDNAGNMLFRPSNDTDTFENGNGVSETLACSYYKFIETNNGEVEEWFEFRTAEHGSSLLKREKQIYHKPWESKRNIDVIFTENGITTCNLKANKFFIIEQYVYRYEDIDLKKSEKIIDNLLHISVRDFSDPLGIANYSVVRPVYMNDEDKYIEIPTDGSVHQHQIEVLRAYEESKKNESFCNPKYVLGFDEFSILGKYEVYGNCIEFKTKNGNTMKSVVSLKDEYGGKTHIAIDDGCYVLYNGNDEKGFVISSWIYPEAHTALKELPNLPVY